MRTIFRLQTFITNIEQADPKGFLSWVPYCLMLKAVQSFVGHQLSHINSLICSGLSKGKLLSFDLVAAHEQIFRIQS